MTWAWNVARTDKEATRNCSEESVGSTLLGMCLYLILGSNVVKTESPSVQVGIAHALVTFDFNAVVNDLVHLLCHRQAASRVLVDRLVTAKPFVIFLEGIFLQVYRSTGIQLEHTRKSVR